MRLKRLEAPAWWPIKRKVKKFSVFPRGPYAFGHSLPLLVLIRDILKFSETAKEARSIIKAGLVKIDGKPCKDYKFGVGLFDVIEIPIAKKAYRVVPKKGLRIIEIPLKEAKLKICKITGKKMIRDGKIQLNLHDGKNILADNSYKVNDSVLLELPEQKIIEHFKFESGQFVVVVKGKAAGIIAKIKNIEFRRVWLNVDENLFEAPLDSVVAIGKEKPSIKVD